MFSTSTSVNPAQAIAKPFCNAAHAFFGMMLESRCAIKDVRSVGDHDLEPITASIGIRGHINGLVCISVTEDMAKKVLHRLTGLETEELDDFVIDAVREMANMIGGQGKRELSSRELVLGLPEIVIDEHHLLSNGEWATIQHILLETDVGHCTLTLLFDSPTT